MKLEEKNNYYEILEVSPSATLQDIHSAYNKVKNAYSDDSVALYSLLSPEECEAILDQVEEAYSILGDPEKRREYDKARGFNTDNTQEGYHQKVINRPDYIPNNSITDLLSETNDRPIQNTSPKEDFKYRQEHSHANEVSVPKVQARNKFGLDFEINNAFEQEIENCTHYTGTFLKQIREYKQVSVERMAEMTKISKTYIKSIEVDDIEKLPAEVYTRGFVYQYAKCLKLNPDTVAASYLNHIRQLKSAR